MEGVKYNKPNVVSGTPLNACKYAHFCRVQPSLIGYWQGQ
ncbi:Uncharacterised protein [Yersinia aldovae]|nr:Uncharacterised protein [Yersinia aldovae]